MRVLLGLVLLVGGVVAIIFGIQQGFADGTCSSTSDGFNCGGNLPLVVGTVALVAGILVLALGGMVVRSRATRAIRQRGRDGQATVLSIGETGTTINDDPLVRLRLTVEPADGTAPYDAEVKTLVSRLAIPHPGDQVAVRYLPADRSKVALAEGAIFNRPPAAAGVTETIDELSRLAALRHSGSITEAEYETLKQRLISS